MLSIINALIITNARERIKQFLARLNKINLQIEAYCGRWGYE